MGEKAKLVLQRILEDRKRGHKPVRRQLPITETEVSTAAEHAAAKALETQREHETAIRPNNGRTARIMPSRQMWQNPFSPIVDAMNDKRRKLIIAALAAIALMGVFPPWVHTFTNPSADSMWPAGYSFIFTTPPRVEDVPFYGIILDVPRLLVQWSIVFGVAGIGWLLLKE